MISVSGIYENGQITLLSPIPQKKAKLIITVLEESEAAELKSEMKSTFKRILGLNRGEYFMSDDFDAPLPDSFWLGEQ